MGALGKEMSEALKIGKGAAVGQFMGTFAKLLVGMGIWLVVTIASFL